MDILDFAMRMEQDGMVYYRDQAARAANPDLKNIFESLAEEEVRHYNLFKGLKDNPDDKSVGDMLKGGETLKQIQNIFIDLSQSGESQPFGLDELTAWTKALRIEEKAEAFYKEKAAAESNPMRKELLLKIAAEEKNHVLMIDTVLTYLRSPQTFVDSAQFKNFRSLEGL